MVTEINSCKKVKQISLPIRSILMTIWSIRDIQIKWTHCTEIKSSWRVFGLIYLRCLLNLVFSNLFVRQNLAQMWHFNFYMTIVTYVCHSFISLACAECNNSLPFSWASSIPLSFHPFPSTSHPSSLTSSCHLFLGLPLSLVSKCICNTFLGILFFSILCTFLLDI
jgi:hypothetical protein